MSIHASGESREVPSGDGSRVVSQSAGPQAADPIGERAELARELRDFARQAAASGPLFELVAAPEEQWADGCPPTFGELVGSRMHQRALTGTTAPFAIRPAFADAQTLIAQLIESSQRGHPVALVELPQLGLLRLFAAASVMGEVDLRLERACGEAKVSYLMARIFWDDLRPHMRVVTTPEIDPGLYAGMVKRDAQDLPTAWLSEILGPPLTWSGDHDLQDLGYAEEYRLEIALSIKELAGGEMFGYLAVELSSAGASALREALAEILNRAVRIARANPAVTAFVIALTTVAILAGVTYARRKGASLRLPNISIAMQGSAQAIGAIGRWHQEVAARIPAAPLITTDLPLEIALARLLAYAPVPAGVVQLAAWLARDGRTDSVDRIEATLAASPLFISNSFGRWQLGMRLPVER
jgi:hypothetical protein